MTSEQRTCTWTFNDWESCTWASECGALFAFNDGDPEDNDFHFCHKCGGELILVRRESETGDEDVDAP